LWSARSHNASSAVSVSGSNFTIPQDGIYAIHFFSTVNNSPFDFAIYNASDDADLGYNAFDTQQQTDAASVDFVGFLPAGKVLYMSVHNDSGGTRTYYGGQDGSFVTFTLLLDLS
jgi:hypothetical protein